MIGVPGFCTVCDKDITKDGKLGPDFSEVEVKWSNGSKMRVGVCRTCATEHRWATPEGKIAIQAWHWTHWNNVRGKYDKDITIV